MRIMLVNSFECADAVLLYTGPMKTPSGPQIIAHPSQLNLSALKGGAPLLLVKDALHAWNATGRRLPVQVRAHPYKLQPSASALKEAVRKC